MSRKHRVRCRVDDYPPEAVANLDALLADVRNTYQDIADIMTDAGYPISKSSIHRYAARTEAAAQRVRAAAEQTRVLIQQIKDGQDIEATEVGSALLLDGLIRRLATAEEEFDELPIDKAGRLLVQLQRTGVYKNRYKEDKRRTIDGLQENLMHKLRDAVQGDEELLSRLSAIISRAAQEEASKDD